MDGRGTGVNGLLLAEGLAREVLFAPNDGYDRQVRALEADARRAGRGLWPDDDRPTGGPRASRPDRPPHPYGRLSMASSGRPARQTSHASDDPPPMIRPRTRTTA